MMRPGDDRLAVYLCSAPVNFRKGIRSLADLVEAHLQRDPFAEVLYVFCNRLRTSIKILYWEGNGFCLWQKRLEQERFFWPKGLGETVLELSVQQLNWLLDGYDISRLIPHPKRQYRSVL